MQRTQEVVGREAKPRVEPVERRIRRIEWLGRNSVRCVESVEVHTEGWDGPRTERHLHVLGEVAEPVS